MECGSTTILREATDDAAYIGGYVYVTSRGIECAAAEGLVTRHFEWHQQVATAR
jgi:hypothetical protein